MSAKRLRSATPKKRSSTARDFETPVARKRGRRTEPDDRDYKSALFAALDYVPRRDFNENDDPVAKHILEICKIPEDFEDSFSSYGPHSGQTFGERLFVAFRHGKLEFRDSSSASKLCLKCMGTSHWKRDCGEP